MAENDDLKLISLWNAAIPLSQATLRFAPENIRKEWAELNKVSAMAEGGKSLAQTGPESRSWFDLLNAYMVGANTVLAPRAELLRNAQSLLLTHIKAGRVIALGFEPPRQIKSVPVHIPAQHWNEFVRWEDSELSSGALNFLEVRVLTPQMAKPIFEKIIADERKIVATLPPPVGRPSIQNHIKAAFDALRDAGQIDTDKSARSHYSNIKQWINGNTSCDADSLSDEGIRAHFSPLFKDLKNSRKQ